MKKPLGVVIMTPLLASVLLVGCTPTEQADSSNLPTVDVDSTSPANGPHGTDNQKHATLEPDANQAPSAALPKSNPRASAETIDSTTIVFKDVVQSNVSVPSKLGELVFTGKNGNQIAISDYLGKQNVVLVFTEGFNGILCPFCQTQTSRLIANYEKFKQQDAEILVVYSGTRDRMDEFIESALITEKQQVEKVPFPIVLDVDFAATDFFEIRDKQVHPSTFVIDKQGAVQLAYVGKDMTADRPSVQAILEKLKSVNQ